MLDLVSPCSGPAPKARGCDSGIACAAMRKVPNTQGPSHTPTPTPIETNYATVSHAGCAACTVHHTMDPQVIVVRMFVRHYLLWA
jgi:hypothetical protein